eukprot:jgi/Botrbrau1/13104/Bobra.0187s0062.1
MRVESFHFRGSCRSSVSHADCCLRSFLGSAHIRRPGRRTNPEVGSGQQPYKRIFCAAASSRKGRDKDSSRINVVEEVEAETVSSTSTAGSNLDLLWHGQPFLVGANIPWKNYGTDFQDGVYTRDWWWGYRFEMGLVSGFRKLAKDGTNLVRLWLFGSGEGFQWDNGVPSLAHNEIDNIKDMLAGAKNWNMKVIPVLLDFRVGRLGGQYMDIITVPEKTTAYINNIVRPLVEACKGDRTVLAWDIINEPEHLFAESSSGGINTYADRTQVRRFVARCAAAIHDVDPDAVVTVGSVSLLYNYQRRHDDVADEREFLYSDEKLREAAAGDVLVEEGLGHLDLIQVHFYGGWKYDMWRDPLYNGTTATRWPRALTRHGTRGTTPCPPGGTIRASAASQSCLVKYSPI